jgi:hypothetical protein
MIVKAPRVSRFPPSTLSLRPNVHLLIITETQLVASDSASLDMVLEDTLESRV